jgi:hypothetical protein
VKKKWNRHVNAGGNFGHEVPCTDCGGLRVCTCPGPEKHKERRDRGWDDRCSSCESAAQKNWSGWLTSLPETRIYDPMNTDAVRYSERKDG